ncbi:FadR/GntR family transcriptional regulator [Virgibacillus xinjiangensis]|uniref:FadR/GntR family transcriptional regulator n=1 Tax=Virgibacillus xinjiangensis TaxID=393090 RepID=A0ABV7CUF0_9BACI
MTISPKQKVYQGVLKEIRRLIETNALQPGDKLPSERQLSETLQAGRSSVREALRAMELLGLIETRHGEGTYLSTYRPFQTVELLSSFILQEASTKEDLLLAKKILEREAAKLAFSHITMEEVKDLEKIIHDSEMDLQEKHASFFHYLFRQVDNMLLSKVWQLMEEFSGTIGRFFYEEHFYRELARYYAEGEYRAIEALLDHSTKLYVSE